MPMRIVDIVDIVVFLGALITAGTIFLNAITCGSYRQQVTRSEMVFLMPTALVVGPVTIVLYIVGLCVCAIFPSLFGIVINPTRAKIWTHSEMLEELLLFVLLSAAVYAGAIWWYRKTFPLVLDLEQRTYHRMDFVGGNLRPKAGTWDDIAGVCVRRASAKGSTYYFVDLQWREQAKLAGGLGGFSKLDRAEAFAAQMADELGLPLVGS